MTTIEEKRLLNRMRCRKFRERHPHYAKERAERFRQEQPEKVKATIEALNKRCRKAIEDAKNKPCADCQQTYPAYVMDFDHVRGEKRYTVSQMRRLSMEKIQEEIAKCDVVCSNCHRERTHQQGYC